MLKQYRQLPNIESELHHRPRLPYFSSPKFNPFLRALLIKHAQTQHYARNFPLRSAFFAAPLLYPPVLRQQLTDLVTDPHQFTQFLATPITNRTNKTKELETKVLTVRFSHQLGSSDSSSGPALPLHVVQFWRHETLAQLCQNYLRQFRDDLRCASIDHLLYFLGLYVFVPLYTVYGLLHVVFPLLCLVSFGHHAPMVLCVLSGAYLTVVLVMLGLLPHVCRFLDVQVSMVHPDGYRSQLMMSYVQQYYELYESDVQERSVREMDLPNDLANLILEYVSPVEEQLMLEFLDACGLAYQPVLNGRSTHTREFRCRLC
eukprot:TRINITY_DN4779_c0_g2_i1.p1 TRINITY_DN4779_c0_g2~~TRINITY_DN4779_c0_g2_i1.p1  ORF type:complete len:316 (+),score=19.06 TRINITY_DN4779_c0_g2_i1:46-993(+)